MWSGGRCEVTRRKPESPPTESSSPPTLITGRQAMRRGSRDSSAEGDEGSRSSGEGASPSGSSDNAGNPSTSGDDNEDDAAGRPSSASSEGGGGGKLELVPVWRYDSSRKVVKVGGSL